MTIELIGYLLAIFIGISLGLIGGGGSILAVPILVYIMAVEPVLATAYSLFIVGTTSLIGSLKNAYNKNIDFKTVLVFGLTSIVTVYSVRAYLVPIIPEVIFEVDGLRLTKDIALMVLFAIVMISASIAMIRPKNNLDYNREDNLGFNYPMILLQGVLVGLLSGLVGAGGGFLIIPALVILAKMPMKLAVGTSLSIVAINSLIGFTGDLQASQNIDWTLLLTFTSLSVLGIFIGISLSKRIEGTKLKKGFGWFVLIMGIYILIKELFFA